MDLERNSHNHDTLPDWYSEQEMAMDPEADFPHDAAHVYDVDMPFPRSPSPNIAAPTRTPSVEITAHHRSPSVEITAYNRAPSVVIIPPPAHQPVGSDRGHNMLLATHQKLDAWATSVKSRSHSPSGTVFGGNTARIRAETAPAAAKALFAVLVHILQKPDGERRTFQSPPGVTVCVETVKVTSFAQFDFDLRV